MHSSVGAPAFLTWQRNHTELQMLSLSLDTTAGARWVAPGQQKAAEASSSLGAFELLDRSALEHVTSMRGKARPPPVSKDEWNTFFNAAGAACRDFACLGAAVSM